jgi:hypothetical protein
VLIILAGVVAGLAGSATAASPAGEPRQAEAACPPLLARSFPGLIDDAVSLCQFKGKVVLIVNTASQCGFTPQYEGLESLYRRYKDRGFVVLGFPANDFAGRNPARPGHRALLPGQHGVSFRCSPNLFLPAPTRCIATSRNPEAPAVELPNISSMHQRVVVRQRPPPGRTHHR